MPKLIFFKDKLSHEVMRLFLIFFIIIFPDNGPTLVKSDSDGAVVAPALYVLGDSLFDSGNNDLLPTLAKADFLPYGSNFARGPTGRFTNGRTVVDFIAEYLRLPYAPPYLSIRGFAQAKEPGLNYASGSCGILHETGKFIGKCLSLEEQVELLRLTTQFELPKFYQNAEKLSNYLSRSVFVISIGSNDYINNYLQPLYPTRALYSPQSFSRLLASTLSQQLQRLYQLGARKVLVFEIGPIGCIPHITRTTKREGQCVEEINQMALMFNDQLSITLKDLSSKLPGSEFILGRVYGLAYDAIKNPSIYGLKDTSNPCCTTWANGTSGCIPGLAPCNDADKHYFWDGFHLTETLYRIVGQRCINDSSICTPKNIKELVEV